jgi:hypothetical protein
MITLRGHYYDGKTSAQVRAECCIYDNAPSTSAGQGRRPAAHCPLRGGRLPRLANTIRSSISRRVRV